MDYLLTFLSGAAMVVLILVADDWRLRRKLRKELKKQLGRR